MNYEAIANEISAAVRFGPDRIKEIILRHGAGEHDDRAALYRRELLSAQDLADKERWRYQDEEGKWLATRDANQRLTAEVERLKRELDAGTEHHQRWTNRLMEALPEYSRYSGDLLHNILCAIESLRPAMKATE